MAATVTGKINALSNFKFTPTSGFYANQTLSVPLALNATYTAGTAADQVDLIGAASYTLAPSASQVIDLTTDLLNPNGGAVNFARVRHLAVQVVCSTDGAVVTLAADATNGATNLLSTGGVPILASTGTNASGLIWNAPNTTGAVVDSTHKRLNLTNNATASVTVYLLVAGASV
jgi:hypothetical protein